MDKKEIVKKYDWRVYEVGLLPKRYFPNKDQGSILGEDEIVAVCGFSSVGESLKAVKIGFTIPNITALMLNISYKQWNIGIDSLNKTCPYSFGGEKNSILFVSGEKTSVFYDSLEKIIQSYVFAYSAIEHFANSTIPDNYVYSRKRNNGGRIGKFNKDQVERSVSLDEKLSYVLPEILKIESLKLNQVWNKYVKLKNARNNIIHFKSKDFYPKSWPEGESIWNELVFAVQKINPALISKEVISYFIGQFQDVPRWYSNCPF